MTIFKYYNRLVAMKRFMLAAPLASLLVGGLLLAARPATVSWNGAVQPPHYKEGVFPPWSGLANDPAVHKGLTFTVPEVDDLPDFHGNPFQARLVIFVGGNYYFAMAPLVQAFERVYPRIKGKLFYETLPPGILIKQMKAGGTITVGNMTWTVKPDVYAAGKLKVAALVKNGLLTGPVISYATNNLTIMIPQGNPGHIKNLRDLGRPGLRLVMPNPAWEGVARQIQLSLKKAGGNALVKMVYQTKVADGQTLLTHIHHRQTPLFLMQGLAAAGVTWKSEAIFQERIGHPISDVSIPAKYNTTAIYAGAVVKGAAHAAAARQWLAFLQSPAATAIFERYGFKPYQAGRVSPDAVGTPAGISSPEANDVPPSANSAAGPDAPWGVLKSDHGRVISFTPPSNAKIPANAYGKMALLGKNIFDHTPQYAGQYIGDGLSCINCHLQSGRLAYSAPLWAAFAAYPRYQAKAKKVVTLEKRIQECFMYSENGKTPPANGKTITALVTYASWLARGAPTGANLPGRGYRPLARPALTPSAVRGKQLFTVDCMMCHGDHGQGLLINGQYRFPPLWGPHSFNSGAGMHKLKLAAEFIQANMPLGKGGTLTGQQAWELAAFVNSHKRPGNPMKK